MDQHVMEVLLFFLFTCVIPVAICAEIYGFSLDMDVRKNHRPLYFESLRNGGVTILSYFVEPFLQLYELFDDREPERWRRFEERRRQYEERQRRWQKG